MPTSSAFWASVAAQLVLIAILPLFGTLSDRFGRKPPLLFFGLGFTLLSVPLFAFLNAPSSGRGQVATAGCWLLWVCASG